MTEPKPKGYWKNRLVAERIDWLRQLVLPHPGFVHAIDAVNRALWRRTRGAPARGIYIEAPSGCGKTTFRQHLQSLYPPIVETEQTFVRCVGFEVPDPCAPVDFANAIFKAMGDPEHHSRRTVEQLRRLNVLLPAVQLELMIIDNIQDVPDRRGQKGVTRISNLMRDWIEQHRIVMVLLGTHTGAEVVNANEQLRRRVPTYLELSGYPLTEPAGLARFLKLIALFERNLPLAEQSELASSPLAKSLAFACGGRLSTLSELLCIAVIRAVDAKREHLVRDDLQHAYREYFGHSANVVDPFSSGFREWRLLDKAGEPHHMGVVAKSRRAA